MSIFGPDKKSSIIGATTVTWEDSQKRSNLMWKVPRNIRFNDHIVVREDEYAVFYRDGKVLDYIDRPDSYALTSINAPIVGKVVQALSGYQQQAEVYYLQKRALDGKFGSKQPYPFKDPDFGIVNLRLFGEFRYKVSSPANFINQFVGTFNFSNSADVEDRLREQVVTLLFDVIGDLKAKGIGVVDLASKLTDIEQIWLERSKSHFEPYGILVEKLSGLYVSLPEEVQKAVDLRSSMAVTGTNYMQYQAGQAMREAAVNTSGGAAGIGVGLGAGVGLGYGMIDQMRQGSQQAPIQQQAPPVVVAAPAGAPCVKCGTMVPQGSKFCPACGEKQEQKACPGCKAALPAGAKFCPSCGAKTGETVCVKCGAKFSGGKFCPECGSPVS
jgi:membrane protease subunit (stomatin/prohibitin family)